MNCVILAYQGWSAQTPRLMVHTWLHCWESCILTAIAGYTESSSCPISSGCDTQSGLPGKDFCHLLLKVKTRKKAPPVQCWLGKNMEASAWLHLIPLDAYFFPCWFGSLFFAVINHNHEYNLSQVLWVLLANQQNWSRS